MERTNLQAPTTSRRTFLQSSGATLAYLSFARCWPARAAVPNVTIERRERVLVLIQLNGGNDGLNTVIPFNNPDYYRLRPTLAVPASQALPLTPNLGLHPACAPLHTLYAANQLSVIQGVGFATGQRSHFRALETWESALPGPESTGTGWLGRYLDKIAATTSTDTPLAVHFYPDLPYVLRQFSGNCRSRQDSNAKNFLSTLCKISRRIVTDPSVRIYCLSMGGFDTHAHQASSHAELLRMLSHGLQDFQKQLEQCEVAPHVLTMVYSEFGRSAAENENRGTDHGTLGPVFLIGTSVSGGVTGSSLPLNLSPSPDERPGVDFRKIYATILEDWLGCPAEPVLGTSWHKLPVILSRQG